MMIWTEWWAWGGMALLLVILEMLIPGFILLGFGIGAAVVAVLLLVGGPLALWLAGSLPLMLVVFAALSLVAWIALRRVVGLREGQVRLFDKDVND